MSKHIAPEPPSQRQVWLTLGVIGMFLLTVTVLAVLNLLTGELLNVLVTVLRLALHQS